ncbi:hypothetical protein ACVIRO_004390 [Rhizobium ruizarguesonis]|jgi:hypothetical protein
MKNAAYRSGVSGIGVDEGLSAVKTYLPSIC